MRSSRVVPIDEQLRVVVVQRIEIGRFLEALERRRRVARLARGSRRRARRTSPAASRSPVSRPRWYAALAAFSHDSAALKRRSASSQSLPLRSASAASAYESPAAMPSPSCSRSSPRRCISCPRATGSSMPGAPSARTLAGEIDAPALLEEASTRSAIALVVVGDEARDAAPRFAGRDEVLALVLLELSRASSRARPSSRCRTRWSLPARAGSRDRPSAATSRGGA